MNLQKMVTFGGGTGHSLLLSGAKQNKGVEITAVVPVTDSGGGTGRLRLEYGTSGSIGDFMRCVAALSPLGGMGKVFGRRYREGYLAGQTVRNLAFAAAELELGLLGAAREMEEVFQIQPHRVMPVLCETATLMAEVGSVIIEGEGEICKVAHDRFWDPKLHPIRRVWIKEPVPAINPAVLDAIANAQWVVIASGDLMTSILPVLSIPGISQAIQSSVSRICVVMNIMTKNGETDGFYAEDFLEWIERSLGRRTDIVLCNDGSCISEAIINRYHQEHKSMLVASASRHDPRFITLPLWKLNDEGVIVHCPEKLSSALRDICRL